MFNLHRQNLQHVFPSFDPQTAADPLHAKHDKIHIEVGTWSLVGRREALDRFASLLPGFDAYDHDGQEFRVFGTPNRPNGTGLLWQIFRGGSGGATVATFHPAFTGRLNRKSAINSPRSPGAREWVLKAELYINPTRFANHQPSYTPETPHPPQCVPAPSEAHSGQCRMSIRGDPPRRPWEAPLIRSDNAAIGAGRNMWLRRSTDWPAVLDLYWEGIWRTIEEPISVAAENAGVQFQRDGIDCTLHSVETYWDFTEPNAVEFVERIMSDLKTIAPRVDVTWNEVLPDAETSNVPEFTIDQNSPRLTLRLRSDETIKIYAKTNTRVRFEFEHKQRPLGRLAGGLRISDLGDFRTRLVGLSEGVASLFGDLIAALARVTDFQSEQLPAHAFILEIIRAVPDADLHETIITLLLNEGRLVRERGGRMRPGADNDREFQDRMQAACDQLQHSGVLTVSNHNGSRWRTLIPAPQFRAALAQLAASRSR